MKINSLAVLAAPGTRVIVYAPADETTRSALASLVAGEGCTARYPCWPGHPPGPHRPPAAPRPAPASLVAGEGCAARCPCWPGHRPGHHLRAAGPVSPAASPRAAG